MYITIHLENNSKMCKIMYVNKKEENLSNIYNLKMISILI